ncbi:MAG: caspase family protein, partial [Pyrinomonadaceae bacterium]
PGLHAFIAGVSLYQHLPGGGGTAAPDNFGMEQLSSTALTAYKIYRWLIERQSHLGLPLATVRLLLSPSAGEVAAEPGFSAVGADRCLRLNFASEARQWRTDVSSNNENVAIFYFAGHGVQRSRNDGVLLLEDFGDPNEGTLHNAAEIINIFNGMAPPASTQKKMARTQFYFVDACRVLPSAFKNFEKMTVPDIFNVELSGSDDRQAPIFFATIPGVKAYAMKNDQTLFSKALIKSLNGAAGTPLPEDAQGNVAWHVSVQSLNRALSTFFPTLTDIQGADQAFSLGGYPTGDPTFHLLDGPPAVEVVLEVDPQDAVPFTRIEIMDDSGQSAQTLPLPLSPHPYTCEVPAGIYSIKATIQPPNPLYVDRPGKPRLLLPPRFPWRRVVTP